jgi:hypothetical protein
MSEVKKVNINITNKKVTKSLFNTEMNKIEKEKKRVASENWNFSTDNYLHENQVLMVKKIKDNNYNYVDDVSKIAIQEINKKIYGYKQQDIIKKLLDETQFINFDSIINKMVECELKCYYCADKMNVLYDISREMKQWSVDRIDNYKGHNLNNFFLACLDCNLKRRRRNDDKFLFTKQLKLVKKDNLVKDNTSILENDNSSIK